MTRRRQQTAATRR